ncbi:hypothetical protein BpHYR1_027732 [Brachionus plicatilis]|uniref:Uncharacterized protein n=1 Tax=Brachionus plicatilis TaxID=10195 RepID=A0A3M7SL56_BRAPC|nr:hypothetical protein BpHYR1_027732 [Brachionus plicatilis]
MYREPKRNKPSLQSGRPDKIRNEKRCDNYKLRCLAHKSGLILFCSISSCNIKVETRADCNPKFFHFHPFKCECS